MVTKCPLPVRHIVAPIYVSPKNISLFSRVPVPAPGRGVGGAPALWGCPARCPAAGAVGCADRLPLRCPTCCRLSRLLRCLWGRALSSKGCVPGRRLRPLWGLLRPLSRPVACGVVRPAPAVCRAAVACGVRSACPVAAACVAPAACGVQRACVASHALPVHQKKLAPVKKLFAV